MEASRRTNESVKFNADKRPLMFLTVEKSKGAKGFN